jgi:hypothetical protein
MGDDEDGLPESGQTPEGPAELEGGAQVEACGRLV